jgi:hypothetical protein
MARFFVDVIHPLICKLMDVCYLPTLGKGQSLLTCQDVIGAIKKFDSSC